LDSLREDILINFFERIDILVQKEFQSVSNKVRFMFVSMNVVRDTDHKITGWNINKSTIPLEYKFDKNSTGVIIT